MNHAVDEQITRALRLVGEGIGRLPRESPALLLFVAATRRLQEARHLLAQEPETREEPQP